MDTGLQWPALNRTKRANLRYRRPLALTFPTQCGRGHTGRGLRNQEMAAIGALRLLLLLLLALM
eukprot:3951562-Lingulodinium_polyedra.AAC.1